VTARSWRTPAVMLASAAAILMLSVGMRQGFGLFLRPMSMDLGWGRETFAFAIALQNLVWGLAQPFTGMVADRFGAGRVLLKPAPEGTGIIAGGAVRAVVESCGGSNVLTKSLGTANPPNVVRAAFTALQQLKEAGITTKPVQITRNEYQDRRAKGLWAGVMKITPARRGGNATVGNSSGTFRSAPATPCAWWCHAAA